VIKLVCPKCKIKLEQKGNDLVCLKCEFVLNKTEGVYKANNVDEANEKKFYDELYNKEKGSNWIKGLEKENIFKKILEKISLSYRRERFFKNNIKGKNNLILDLACGAGRAYFREYGEVVGIDLSLRPLEVAKEKYDLVILGGVDKLPFPDGIFDYVVSSDFFGHVRNEEKNKIIKEIYRILKPGGKTLHVIETDSENTWFKFAHKYPELFQKYFIDQIGGHIGLEMPNKVIERWRENNFEIVKAVKIWGLIWPIQDYKNMFDNEYQKKSFFIKALVLKSKILSKLRPVREMINTFLNPINSLVEFLTDLNHGQGIMLICQKK